MNPLILLGLGAVALMAMGKKKSKSESDEEPDESSDESPDETVTRTMTRTATPAGMSTRSVVAKKVPTNYQATINSQTGTAEAKQCHLQGMNDVDQITLCIANKLFPGWDWASRSGWQNTAWAMMKNLARIELGLPPITT